MYQVKIMVTITTPIKEIIIAKHFHHQLRRRDGRNNLHQLKEMKTVQTPVSSPQNSPKRPKSAEPLIDENSNLGPKNLKTTVTAKHRSRKLLEFTPSLFRKGPQRSNKSASDNELVTSRKVPKMAWENVEENITGYKGYFSDSPSEINPIDNGDGTNRNVDKSPRELKIESENIIFSQLSETSRKHFLGQSVETPSRKSVTREADNSYKFCSPALQDLSCKSPTIQEFFSPTLLSQPETRVLNRKKIPPKNVSQNSSRIVRRNPLFKVGRNLAHKWTNNYDVIDQQFHSPNYQSHSEYVIPSPGSSIQFDGSLDDQKIVTHKNFFINHFEKQNRSVVFPQNHTTDWRNTAQRRHILGEIRQPPNPVLNPLRKEMSFVFPAVSGFSYNETYSSPGSQESTHLINSDLRMQNVYRGFQIPNNIINAPLTDEIAVNLSFKSSQSSVYSPVMSEPQSKENGNLRNYNSTSTSPIFPEDEQKLPESQEILISDDEEEQVASQQIISPDVTGILTTKEDISSDQNRELIQLESSIHTGEGLFSLSPVTHQLDGEENKFLLGTDFSNKQEENVQCQGDISNSGNILSHEKVNSSYGMNLCENCRIITLNINEEVSKENVSNADKCIPNENRHFAREHQPSASTEICSQLTPSSSSLPTDNSNPWLNVTSQDFSQENSLYNTSALSQDSGQASKDSLTSQHSFISTTSEEGNDSDGDDENINDHFLSISQILNVEASTMKKYIERIIHRLESEV
ncbi:uncharacterized protein LOC107045014 isoform X2 [Diachasma alloeum]|uniref:uncharacterized protein LOC107045014 isoform X2 n=1 Tax=Diachasma alloeum TaxID=454923 RepID=UPI0007384CCE|nr:uncharacterized protein LOC107045014 isoform X2 [Diachasma alloeum]